MLKCWKNVRKISLIFLYIIFAVSAKTETFSPENQYINSNKVTTMFSSRIIGSQELFIVKNDEAIIRTVKNKKFNYKAPDDNCYNLENGANVCISNGKIDKINGINFSISNENVITNTKYQDEFFTENSNECNKMKFDLTNTICVKNQPITGFQTQMYLPDYYSVIKLVLFRPLENDMTYMGHNKEKNIIYVFTFSQNYDIGCAHFADYKVFKKPIEIQEGTKKKKKNKKIVAKNKQELLKTISTESYKKLLLKNYVYLQPASDKDEAIKIILSLHKNRVTQINELAINLQWSQIGAQELLSLPANESDNKVTKQKTGK